MRKSIHATGPDFRRSKRGTRRRAVLATLVFPFLLAGAYTLAGYGLGALALDSGEQVPAGEGVPIFVYSNGYHASLVLPLRAAGIDWAERFPAADFARPQPMATHVMLGWGERDFYMNTRTLADAQAGTAVRAILGLGGAVMHVALIGEPAPGASVRPLMLSTARYAALAAYADASFARDAAGGLRLHPGRGYGGHDAFYEGIGRYTAFNTCNEWVGRGLRLAGVPAGIWTPFASSLLRDP